MQDITIKFSNKAEKQFRKLDLKIVDKFHRQVKFLLVDKSHPSLGLKKVKGSDVFEARIDYHNRFTFIVEEKTLWILSIGPHDEGLGKK